MSDPASYRGVSAVQHIETHISEVFLAGDRAYKLKRAVKLPYADFSTPAIRHAACKKELELNHQTSSEIYLRVRRITKCGAGLEFDGPGDIVDAVVEMRRFDQKDILDNMALDGDLSPDLMSTLAREIAAAHQRLTAVPADGSGNINGVLDINYAGFHASRVFSGAEIEKIDAVFRTNLKRLEHILKKRADRGCIKRCHGDLHLRNICMFGGRPQLFDCIDFNDQLATVDVLYDLAFLAMDLWHRGLRNLVNVVVNHYLDASVEEEDGYACLPYFMALRAAVRAHVLATQSEDPQIPDSQDKRVEARSYYDLALALLTPNTPQLVAIGGFSGSGKSTIAGEIAPFLGVAPGARLIESDRTRKAIFGVDPEVRLAEGAYTPEVSDTVYAQMATRAAALLNDNCPVVVDAVFDRPERRRAVENAAREASVPFQGIWLDADPHVLKHRIEARATTASDATRRVLEMQLARGDDSMSWARVSTSCSLHQTIQKILDLTEV